MPSRSSTACTSSRSTTATPSGGPWRAAPARASPRRRCDRAGGACLRERRPRAERGRAARTGEVAWSFRATGSIHRTPRARCSLSPARRRGPFSTRPAAVTVPVITNRRTCARAAPAGCPRRQTIRAPGEKDPGSGPQEAPWAATASALPGSGGLGLRPNPTEKYRPRDLASGRRHLTRRSLTLVQCLTSFSAYGRMPTGPRPRCPGVRRAPFLPSRGAPSVGLGEE